MTEGSVAPGFEAVREEFERNFAERRELGGAVAAYVKGEKVVDLWGGVRDARDDSPWEEDTLVIVYSTSKGLAAMTLALAHSRGWLDYDERVAAYWPEFAAERQGRGHGAPAARPRGRPAGDRRARSTRTLIEDFDRLADAIARQKPLWKPGTRHGYHGISLGWYMGELIRRVDPDHRTLGRFFAEEIAEPLGARRSTSASVDVRDGYARIERANPLQAAREPARPAAAHGAGDGQPGVDHLQDLRQPAHVVARRPRPQGVPGARVPRRRRARQRALDRARLRGVRGAQAGARADEGDARRDDPLPRPTGAGLARRGAEGGHRLLARLRPAARAVRFGSSDRSFGHPGAGGSFAFADPGREVSFAYVTNRLGMHLNDDPREKSLRDALYRCL